MSDPYTMEFRLCDDSGLVSYEKTPPNLFAPGLTYIGQMNNLKSYTGEAPYTGAPFGCTGHAHLAVNHIRCTSPIHALHGSVNGPGGKPLAVVHLSEDSFNLLGQGIAGVPGTLTGKQD